jgi:hypothetical protein
MQEWSVRWTHLQYHCLTIQVLFLMGCLYRISRWLRCFSLDGEVECKMDTIALSLHQNPNMIAWFVLDWLPTQD